MKRFPWLKMRKKTDPELPLEPPIWFGNHSNGEYFHHASKKDRKIRKLILEKADENARRLGMDRRQFLASAMGMTTSLWVLNYVAACSGGDSGKDAKLDVPKDATLDNEIACATVGGDEFIFDVQTHWLDKSDLRGTFGQIYIQAFGPLFDVATEDYYIQKMFCESDTTMAALTEWPGVTCAGMTTDNCGLPLSNARNVQSRDHINDDLAHKTQRVVSHCQVMVQDPQGLDYELAIMDDMHNNHGVSAWKMYPGFKPIFTMDDANGRRTIEHGLSLGVPLFCVHKGLPIGAFFDVDTGNHPRDIGIVAKDYPDARFVIYHSAICTGFTQTKDAPPEGPFDPADQNPVGTNALIKAVLDNGIQPGGNVYGEVGSALNQVQKSADAAAHFFGKLMLYLGTDNVVWGTDCVLYGSPQPFIEWFRALEIPQAMRDQYKYPALDNSTAEGKLNKAKIFGLNAAKLYGVDVKAQRCKVDSCPTTRFKREVEEKYGPRKWMFQEPLGPRTWSEYLAHAEEAVKRGRPG